MRQMLINENYPKTDLSQYQHINMLTLFSSDADNNLMCGRFDVRNSLAGNSDNASCPHIYIFI